MAVTIKTVAKEAGVSIATVSRVLNNKDRVKDSTRKRIENAIEKLKFSPNPIARTMIIKETKSIGLFVPTLSSEYWALLSEAIQDELWNYGYTVMLCSLGLDNSPKKELAYLKSMAERRVDGIIWGSLMPPENRTENHFLHLSEAKIPMVTLDTHIPGIDRVSGDNSSGALMAVQHLIGLGHKNIAYIHGNKSICDNRELGYRNAHAINAIPIDEKLITRTVYSVKNGYEAMETLLQSSCSFSSVFCWNDQLAFGAIRALQDNGLDVPQDVAVVGFDDISMASTFKPSLTTVRQPVREIASSIVKMLMESIENPGSQSLSKNTTLQMQLIIRESCGAK